MYMSIHSIHELQAQFLDKIKISVNCSVDRVNQLITQKKKKIRWDHGIDQMYIFYMDNIIVAQNLVNNCFCFI